MWHIHSSTNLIHCVRTGNNSEIIELCINTLSPYWGCVYFVSHSVQLKHCNASGTQNRSSSQTKYLSETFLVMSLSWFNQQPLTNIHLEGLNQSWQPTGEMQQQSIWCIIVAQQNILSRIFSFMVASLTVALAVCITPPPVTVNEKQERFKSNNTLVIPLILRIKGGKLWHLRVAVSGMWMW